MGPVIEVFMLVATLAMDEGPSRVVAADWPFFRTAYECQQKVERMRNIPPQVDTVICERRLLDIRNGRVVR